MADINVTRKTAAASTNVAERSGSSNVPVPATEPVWAAVCSKANIDVSRRPGDFDWQERACQNTVELESDAISLGVSRFVTL